MSTGQLCLVFTVVYYCSTVLYTVVVLQYNGRSYYSTTYVLLVVHGTVSLSTSVK
jgi:hypothetical protein